jgi:hypothetical protein
MQRRTKADASSKNEGKEIPYLHVRKWGKKEVCILLDYEQLKLKNCMYIA